ncbi:MAG: DMT family transporter [Alphaproteobacteria bacterium]
MSETARGVLGANLSLLGAIVIWGSFFPLMAKLLQTWDPYSNAAGRAALGALALLAMATARHGTSVFRTRLPWRRVLALAVFGIASFNILMTLGVAIAGPISASIVATTGPVSAAVLGRVLYKSRIRPIIVVAATLAMAGGVCVAMGRGGTIADLRGGELLVLGASVSWLWYSMRINEWLADVPHLQATAITYLVAAVVLVLAVGAIGALGLHPLSIDLSAGSIALMVTVSLSATAIAVVLWLRGVKRLGVTVGAAYGNLVPVITVAAAAPFGIVPHALELVGGGIVIVGVMLAQWGTRRGNPL